MQGNWEWLGVKVEADLWQETDPIGRQAKQVWGCSTRHHNSQLKNAGQKGKVLQAAKVCVPLPKANIRAQRAINW